MSRRAFAFLPSSFHPLSCMLVALLSLSRLAYTQVQPGTPSWSAYDSHEVDTINLSNLVVSLNIPVMSKSGAFPLNFGLLGGDSFITVSTPGNILGPAYPSYPLQGIANRIVGYGIGATYFTGGSVSCPSGDGSGTANPLSDWAIFFTDGTAHALPSTATSYIGTSCSGSFTATTVDGSGYTVSVTGRTVNSIYDRNGTSISESAITDSNGNSISYSCSTGCTWTDTLLFPKTVQTSSVAGGFDWYVAGGGSVGVAPTYTDYYLKSSFGCSGYTDYNQSTYSQLPTNYAFPDNTNLAFTWEPNGSGYSTGRTATITLRSGGKVTYNWNPNNASHDGLNCTYLVPTEITRATSDGTTSYALAWQTSGGSCSASAACSTTTVVDPGGNKKVYTFSAGWGATSPVTLAMTEVQTYENTGTIASPTYSSTPNTTDITCYNASTYNSTPTNCVTASVSEPISSTWVYHQVGASKPSLRETKVDNYGDVTYSAQYDFGVSTPTFQTTITYGSWNGSGCTAWTGHVQNKACEVLKQDGSGNKLSDIRMAYSSAGNLLSTSVFNGSIYIGQTTNNSYNSNGTIATSYDLANNKTTYIYSSGQYSDCGTPGCAALNPVFPTKVENPSGGVLYTVTWDMTGAVPLQIADGNGNAIVYGYGNNCGSTADPFWRVGCVTDPLGNAQGVSYMDSSNQVERLFSFNSGNSVNNVIQTVDGYGRLISTQEQTGPSATTYDTANIEYSWPAGWTNGIFRTFTSMPCSASSGGSCSDGTYTGYDVIGRVIYAAQTGANPAAEVSYTYYSPSNSQSAADVLSVISPAPTWDGENTKQTISEYDGLGRLKSSCGVLSSGGSTCTTNGGSPSASGVVTSNSYLTAAGVYEVQSTRGLQTSTTYTDSLGRVTESITPDAGTWRYYYDSSSSCSGSTNTTGRLVETADPNGTDTCYSYDVLGRVTLVYANGTSSCTQRLFYYDGSLGFSGTIPTGVSTPTNSYGRLVEAATSTCSAPVTLLTDEWFSYDKDGDPTDMWEYTPNSSTYYHTQATFFGNGAVNTLKIANPNSYTQTYGLDGEGRPSSLTSSSGPNQVIVSGTIYNASSQPTNIAIGSGTDYDGYAYDPNTGRVTNWTFQVGTNLAQENATLTWNTIGTLKSLAITDGFNSGGTQTCNFGSSSNMGYDDLSRLVYDDCGSGGWGQTFGYDQYNNLTKAVISGRTGITFNPGYNSTNNRYASSFGTTYDSNGNILYDASSMNTYAWNEFSKMKSVNASGTNCATSGECLVYDAFGRTVEIDSGSTYTEILYSQLGKTIYLNGSTIKYAYWPAPGGGTLLQNPGSFYYEHKDWLGNARISSSVANEGIIDDRAFAPYGEIYATYGSTAQNENIFTGDTQDIVSGMYDTPNRELVANQGRWISPDPAQSGWNAYAYGANPNITIDPTGLNDCGGREACGDPGDPGDPSGPGDPAPGYDILGSDDGTGLGSLFAWADFWGGDTAATLRMFGSSFVNGDLVLLPGYQCAETTGDYVCWNTAIYNPVSYGGRLTSSPRPAACNGVTPSMLNYTMPQIYLGENGNPITQSAQQHIQQGHIFPGEAGNTMYGFVPWPGTNAAFQQVQVYNAATFTFGQSSQEGGANGNISFTLDFPVMINPFNNLPAVIGYSLYDGPGVTPLNTNKLVLAANCKLVRTSYPTE